MKSIGICIPTIEGGVICHQEIGREAARRGTAYPQLITHTLPYEAINWAVTQDDWESLLPHLVDSVDRTAKAGADIAIISANTVHIVFDKVAAQAAIPVLSILDVTSDYCLKKGYARVGILGTTPTIRHRIYDDPLAKRGIATAYPPQSDQDRMMNIIINELIRGVFLDQSREHLEDTAKRLAATCDAIVLGCTELPLVLTEEACGTKLVDTTRILAHAALDAATEHS
jgi:aspartate racemase